MTVKAWGRLLASAFRQYYRRKQYRETQERFEQASRLMEAPPGDQPTVFRSWMVIPNAGGTLRVRRSREWYKPRRGTTLLFGLPLGVLLGSFITVPRIPSPAEKPDVWFVLLLFFGAFVFCLGAFIWYSFSSEEWDVDADSLVVQKRLLSREWVHTYRRAALSIEPRRPVWRLIAETSEGKRVLATSCVAGHYQEDPTELRSLAMMIAERTGWPLHIEER
jgi:hypothetical protein